LGDQPAHLRLRKLLDGPLPPAIWPKGYRAAAFADIDPGDAHHVLELCFPGLVAPFADWHGNLIADSEFDPALCLAAIAADGRVAGFIQCWTSAFIKDLAVAPEDRGKGIGSALLVEMFARFSARGDAHVDLKVLASEMPARRLYARLGMVDISSPA
jgi:ribosomal protein S18 acetylase RimI-like enzyme